MFKTFVDCRDNCTLFFWFSFSIWVLNIKPGFSGLHSKVSAKFLDGLTYPYLS